MQLQTIDKIKVLQFENLLDKHLFHFTTTRLGGTSKGNYESLNLGNLSDDKPENVYENRKRLVHAIKAPVDKIFIPHQTHSNNIRIINADFLQLPEEDQRLKLENIDALITNQPHVAIGVTTADCVPIVIFDPQKKVLAAIHAGWKGTISHIAMKTIKVMAKEFDCIPQHLLAGIGPSISPEKFEVGDEVGTAFEKSGFNLDNISFRNKNTYKLHIDLWKSNEIELVNAGLSISHIQIARMCTMSNPDLFFSARRQTINSGRMLTGGIILS